MTLFCHVIQHHTSAVILDVHLLSSSSACRTSLGFLHTHHCCFLSFASCCFDVCFAFSSLRGLFESVWKQKTTVPTFIVLSELVVELLFVACGWECRLFHVDSLRERDLYRAIVQTTAEFKYTCHLTELRRRNYSRMKVSQCGSFLNLFYCFFFY